MTTTDKPEGYVFGRPSKYRPEMCEQVVEWGKLGKSKAWIASELNIARSTLDEWCKDHPDFSEAITRAHTHSQRWWEDKGQNALDTREFQSAVWSRSMGARFPDDWREKVGHVGGNKDDEPIKQDVSFGADAFTRSIIGLVTRSGEDGETGSSDAGNQG